MMLKLTRCFLGTARRFQSKLPTSFTVDRLTGEDTGIVLFRINRPDARNAVNEEMLTNMCNAVNEVKYDRSTRVVIIRSDVAGVFCGGGDLKERAGVPLEDIHIFTDKGREFLNDIEKLPQPVIAALDGYALGAGFEMALACDIRISSDNAKMGLVEAKHGLSPAAGGTQRLLRLIGPAKAKEVVFTGRMVNGSEAHSLGMTNHVVPQNSVGDAAYQKALNLAQEILPQAPVSLKVMKTAITKGQDMDLYSGLTIEQLCYAQVIPTKDRVEGLRAFKEKRKPIYTGQ